MDVRCDKCRIMFSARLYEEEKQIGNEVITQTYMQCPVCASKFPVCYDTPETFALKKKIKKMSHAIGACETVKARQRMMKRLQKKRRMFDEKMEQAKQRYCGEKENEDERNNKPE